MGKKKIRHLKEAVKEMDLMNHGDSESAHVEADDILLAYLRKTGAAELADAFERCARRITFWYA